MITEYVCALAIGLRVGFHYSIPFSAYFISALTVVAASGIVLVLYRLARYALEGEEHPAARLMREADYARIGDFALGVILVGLQMAVLSWLKIMLPIAETFWADPYLANIDHALFFGDPWHYTHALFGWASILIDKAYITWAPIKFAALLVLLSLPPSALRSRSLIAYFLIVAAVALGQYLLPSAGPVLYSAIGLGDRFAAIPIEPWVHTARDYLWSDYLKAGGKIGTGISAMPSLHVAIALWLALVLRSCLPKLAVVGWAYFALILIGSVHLGWHYAVDGIAAIAIVLAAWGVAALYSSELNADNARAFLNRIIDRAFAMPLDRLRP